MARARTHPGSQSDRRSLALPIMSTTSPANTRRTSWWHALWLIIPSALATALAWNLLHSVPIAYVALLTTASSPSTMSVRPTVSSTS
jgi:hypothetical protein